MNEPIPIFKVKILQNKLIVYDSEKMHKYLKPYEGREMNLIIEKPRQTNKRLRSVKQNRYYWGIVIQMISDETGEYPEAVHDAMKMIFLKHKSKYFETLYSTTRLTTLEFCEYCEKIRIWASEFLNLNIPTVDDFYKTQSLKS